MMECIKYVAYSGIYIIVPTRFNTNLYNNIIYTYILQISNDE